MNQCEPREVLSVKIFATRILFIAFWLFLQGCDNSPDLERTVSSQKASLSATFLTENPDEINFPIRVLFAIDASASMGYVLPDGSGVGADPYGKRFDAVREFISRYNDDYDDVSFEVMVWNSGIASATQNENGQRGFTKDTDELNRVLSFNANDSQTDYWDTLEGIYVDIQRDIVETENKDNLSRTKYVVIFLSDGNPDANGRSTNFFDQKKEILKLVTDVREMVEGSGVGSFNFHTFLLEDPNLPADILSNAEEILEEMATEGGGRYERFTNADSIDFNIIDMRLTVEYFVKYIVAYNHNVNPGVDVLLLDSDGDGLSDEEELVYGSDPTMRDTDNDGLSDYMEKQISSPGNEKDPTVFDSPCDLGAATQWPDTDADGLTDCEEFVQGTKRRIADTDYDGMPDYIEHLMGTSPIEQQDTDDMDFDGSVDWKEVHHHTNVQSNDPIIQERYSYQYDIVDRGLITLNQGTQSESYVREFSINVSNIHILDSKPRTDILEYTQGDNFIQLYIAQVPSDQPDSTPIFRRATVTVNINDPDKNVVITPSDFELIP